MEIRQARAGWWSPHRFVIISLGFAMLTAACSSSADSIASDASDRATGEISSDVSNDVSASASDEASSDVSDEATNEVSESIPDENPDEDSDGDSDSVATDAEWLDGYAASFDPAANSDLYLFAGGGVELIGEVSSNGAVVQLTDIAIAADGTLYGATFSELLTIDPSTAKAQTVGVFTVGSVNALAVLPDGQLLAADLDGKVSLVDPSTAEQTSLLSYPAELTSSGDLIAMPDGTIYATATDGTVDYLVAIDISAETAEVISENLPNDVYGLMVSERGDLYGLTFATATGLCNNGEVIRIDPAVGSYESDECLAFRPGGAASYYPLTSTR